MPVALHAQPPTKRLAGKVKGAVKDSDYEIIPQVKIVVEDKKQKTRREFMSDEKGDFEFELPVGTYKVHVEKEGYRSPKLKALRVRPDATVTFDIVFPPVFNNDDPNPTRN